jgi:hypothetical protein
MFLWNKICVKIVKTSEYFFQWFLEHTWMKYSKTQDSVYCAPCRFFGPYVNCIRFQIKLNPLHIWQNKISKSTTYLYCIALLNILFLKIYGQKLTCCSWKLGFREIIFSARKLQECRILQHLPQTPCRKATSGEVGKVSWPSTRLLNRFEYTSFWGSYAPGSYICFAHNHFWKMSILLSISLSLKRPIFNNNKIYSYEE